MKNESPTSDLGPLTSARAWLDKRVLVTGGAGFIGSHLVEALDKAGAQVTVLDNLQAGKWENLGGADRRPETTDLRLPTSDLRPRTSGLRCLEGDVRDAACVRSVLQETQPDVVFHLAANASVPGSVEDPAYDFESNSLGTFVVLDQIRKTCPSAKVVIASSGAVYGEPATFPLTEASPVQPISPYGASKLSAEVEAGMFRSVYDIHVVIARIFNTYGPRMPRFVVFDFLKKLQADPQSLEILGSGKQVRDLNFVSDTVRGLQVLALRGEPGQAYNVASGKPHSVTAIALMLLNILDLKQTELRYTGESWAGDAQHWEVSIEKLESLGYLPELSLSEGLKTVQEWFSRVYG